MCAEHIGVHLPVSQFMRRGDTGVGRCAHNEVVMCDGIAYMVCARGDAHMLLPDDELSSGIASAFDETATPCSTGNVASLTQLKRCLGGLTTRTDAWMARVSGALDRVSLAGREKAVLEHEYGDLICVFCPGAGWRIDYLSRDRRRGGAVRDLAARDLKIQVWKM